MDTDGFLEKRFARTGAVAAREIMGELVFVPLHQSAGRVDRIFTANEVGAFIWASLDGEASNGALVEALVNTFETDAPQAEADLRDFLNQLVAIGAIREV